MLLLIALCWLAAWRWASPRIDCPVSSMFLFGIWAAAVSASYEWVLLMRLGFVAHYLRHGGILARWLTRRALLFAWCALKNLPIALILFTTVISLSVAEWLMLAADVPLFLLMLVAMSRLFDHEATAVYARPLARLWAHRINAAVLWITLMVVNFYTPHPDYRGLPWDMVAHTAAAQVDCGCDVVATLGRFDAVGQSLAWWAAENFLSNLTDARERYAAWLAFLATFGISFLVAWSYSRTLVGVLSRPWRLTSPSTAITLTTAE